MTRERVLNGFNCMALFLKLNCRYRVVVFFFVFYSIAVYILLCVNILYFK